MNFEMNEVLFVFYPSYERLDAFKWIVNIHSQHFSVPLYAILKMSAVVNGELF